MLDKLKHFLSESIASHHVAERLPEEQIAVAAILLEMADADRIFTPEEFREVMIQLRAYFGLSADQVQELLTATAEARQKATDLFPFTSIIARSYTPEKKEEVLTMVWQVVFADGRLDPYEDQLAGRLRSLLAVNHSVLIAAKERAREIQRARQDPGASSASSRH